MAAITTLIAAASLAVAAGGAAAQYAGSQTASHRSDDALKQQQQLEAKRQQQMELDAARRKRELVRNQIAARSAAVATATSQGASAEGSSALPGAYGSISGRTNVNELGVNQNLELGQQTFALNEGILGSYRGAAEGTSMASFGAGLSSLGGALLKNEGVISRIGTYFTTPSVGSPYDSVGTPTFSYGSMGPR